MNKPKNVGKSLPLFGKTAIAIGNANLVWKKINPIILFPNSKNLSS